MKQPPADKQELFASMPVPKALLTMAVPTIISQLINLIYNIVTNGYFAVWLIYEWVIRKRYFRIQQTKWFFLFFLRVFRCYLYFLILVKTSNGTKKHEKWKAKKVFLSCFSCFSMLTIINSKQQWFYKYFCCIFKNVYIFALYIIIKKHPNHE